MKILIAVQVAIYIIMKGAVSVEGAKSAAGTEGYIPREGAGTPVADIFSLGRTLYQAATGSAPNQHPGLPTNLSDRTDRRELMRLMEIINKACANFHEKRYPSADLLKQDLVKLQSALRPNRLFR